MTDTDSEDDDTDEDLPMPIPKKAADRKPRASVSAEAFGDWNKKEDFTPPVNEKSDEAKDRI